LKKNLEVKIKTQISYKFNLNSRSLTLEKHFKTCYNQTIKKKETKMSVAKITRDFIEQIEDTKIFTYNDIPSNKKSSVAIELSRLFKKGVVKKISKGKFYKPKQSRFGEIAPSDEEIAKSYLVEEDAYITGYGGYNRLGLMTQIPNVITIASNRIPSRIRVENVNIRFVPNIANGGVKDTQLLQILDALRDIKNIPDNSPNDVVLSIKKIVRKFDVEKIKKMLQLVRKYPPRVKAILGAILKEMGRWEEAYLLKEMLNPLTTYKIGISGDTLPNRDEWKIA
jgi:hypothetical protein